LTISKSFSWRSRNLYFVLTPPSSPKSLDQDWEICPDQKFLANLDSLSQSRSWVSQFYHISRSRFLNLSRFLSLKSLKKSWKSLENVEISQQISKSLDKSRKSWQSRFILTVSMKILTQLNLDWKVSTLKILAEKKNNFVSTVRIMLTSFKSWSWQIEKSGSRSRLVSTVEAPRITWNPLNVIIDNFINRLMWPIRQRPIFLKLDRYGVDF
jgi:hypothetical protein